MDKKTSVQLSSIELKNFRCFSHLKLDLSAPYILLEGANGIGKTSVLEALYYTCYLRSFRTYSPKELITFDHNEFFVKVAVDSLDGLTHDVHVGVSKNKRLVKVDHRAISSYKELMSYYRIVSLTEDDLALIQASPHYRRLFIDQMLLLLSPEYGQTLKSYRQIVDQKNAFLYQNRRPDMATYQAFSYQQWKYAFDIETKRREILVQLSQAVKTLNEQFVAGGHAILFAYRPKKQLEENFDVFQKQNPHLPEQEFRYKRSLFGVHLDDISITLKNQFSRTYASRGQQKLILLLLKIAQLRILSHVGSPSIFLLDDFMTDFDEKHALELISALDSVESQLIFTAPVSNGMLAQKVKKEGGKVVKLQYEN